MTNRIIFLFLIIFCCASLWDIAYSQDDLRIWNEFINVLRDGKISLEKIQPHQPLGDSYKPILLGYLDSVKTQAAPEDWNAKPEVFRIENRIQYIIP